MTPTKVRLRIVLHNPFCERLLTPRGGWSRGRHSVAYPTDSCLATIFTSLEISGRAFPADSRRPAVGGDLPRRRQSLRYGAAVEGAGLLGFVPEKLDRIPGLVLSIKSRLPSNVGRSL